jgi:predicted Zn-dependent protease
MKQHRASNFFTSSFSNARHVCQAISGCLILVSLGILPLVAEAAGTTDSIWTRPTYESKMFEIGDRIIAANNIRTPILFRMSQNSADLDAVTEKDHRLVTVGSALFPIIRSDDELAAVLSHEIAHLIQGKSGHFAGLSLFDILGTVIFVPDALLTTASMGHSIKQRLQRATVQNRETEMDIIGLDLMVKAGYNPLAMETILDKIANDEGNKHWRSRITLTQRISKIHEAISQRYPQFLPNKKPDLVSQPISMPMAQSPADKPEDTFQMNATSIESHLKTVPQE